MAALLRRKVAAEVPGEPEEPAHRFLVCGDAVKVTHGGLEATLPGEAAVEEIESAAIAASIEKVLGKLSGLATEANLSMLAYLIECAADEARRLANLASNT